MGGFLTIGYCSGTLGNCFPIVFWKFLWGDKALMEGDKVVMGGDPPSPPTRKTLGCYQEFCCNPKMRVALFKLTAIDSILLRTPLMSSSKTHAPQPTELSRGFYSNLNSAFSE